MGTGILWTRDHTEIHAKFALDPNYLYIQGEDTNGFRAIAQRSKLSDAGKDSGEVSMFPKLRGAMVDRSASAKKLAEFQHHRLHRLKNDYGVNWVIVQNRANLAAAVPISERSHYGLPTRLISSLLSLSCLTSGGLHLIHEGSRRYFSVQALSWPS